MPPTARSFSARGRLRSTAPTAIPRGSSSSRSFDPCPDPAAEKQRPCAVAEHAVCGLAEVREGLCYLGRLIAEDHPGAADALGEADQARRICVPPSMCDELAGVAKPSARPDLGQVPLLRPRRRAGGTIEPLARLPARPEMPAEGFVDLGLHDGRDVVVAGSEDAAVAEETRAFGEN